MRRSGWLGATLLVALLAGCSPAASPPSASAPAALTGRWMREDGKLEGDKLTTTDESGKESHMTRL